MIRWLVEAGATGDKVPVNTNVPLGELLAVTGVPLKSWLVKDTAPEVLMVPVVTELRISPLLGAKEHSPEVSVVVPAAA